MLLSGVALAKRVEDQIKNRVAGLPFTPRLVIVLVGNDPASVLYDQRKQAAAARIGIACELMHHPHTTTAQLITIIQNLNSRPDVDGILVQLPLPDDIDTEAVISAIDPVKDVDGFHPKNIAQLVRGEEVALPPLIQAIIWLLEETTVPLTSKHAVIIGKSDIFLEPLSHILTKLGMGVSWVRPQELPSEKTTRADVLVVAAGRLGCVTAHDIKPHSIVIDIGINRTATGKVCGDVLPDAATVADFFTPTPGGVGPVTISAALNNVVKLALRRRI